MVKVTKAYPQNFFGDKKLVLEFEGKRKALKLNETQAEDMMTITGTEHERQWIGAEIVLTDKRNFNGTHTIHIGMSRPAVKQEAARNVPIVEAAK